MNSLVSKFKNKGYKIADESLGNSDRVGGAKILVGCDNLAILMPMRTRSFGTPNGMNPSMFWDTPVGILLVGKVPALLENAKHLESATSAAEPNF